MNVWVWMIEKHGYSAAFHEWEKLYDLREKAKAETRATSGAEKEKP